MLDSHTQSDRIAEILDAHKGLEGPLLPILHAIQEAFGRQCVPFNVPDATGGAFAQVLCALDPPPVGHHCPLPPCFATDYLPDAAQSQP